MREKMELKLKELRKSKKISQYEIANFLGVTQATYNRYETGKSEPSLEILVKLANYFGITLDELCNHDISQLKKEDIKKFGDIKNKCYNVLVSLTNEQAMLVYAFMQGLAEREF